MTDIWLPADNHCCPSKLQEGERTYMCSNYKNHSGLHYDAFTGKKW